MPRNARQSPAQIAVVLINLESDRATLETLGLLAAAVPAEIHALFVEDVELLSLADLPLAREVCRLTRVERGAQARELERQFRVQARAAEQSLSALARRRGLHCSFRTVRGEPATLLRETLEAMDLMLLGAARRALSLAGSERLITRGLSPRPPVVVVFDGSETAQRALGVAARLARAADHALTVLLTADTPATLEARRAEVVERLGPQAAAFREVVAADMDELIGQLQSLRAHSLVIGRNEDLLSTQNIERLRRQPGCPLVLVN